MISIASGKGGVGKTLTTVNIGLSLGRIGYNTMILDGDMGLSNVDVVMGLEVKYNLHDALEHSVPLSDVVLEASHGVKILPSGSGLAKMTRLGFVHKVHIIDQIASLYSDLEFLLVDTGAGIHSDVLHLNALADIILIVTTPEPHAMTDAYAFMKVMSQDFGKKRFSLLVNQVKHESEGTKVFDRLADVSKRFLDVEVQLAGIVPLDPMIHRFVMCRDLGHKEAINTVAGQAWRGVSDGLLASLQEIPSNDPKRLWQSILFGRNTSPAVSVG